MVILVKPLVTEKVSNMNANGVYGFIVHKSANKIQIKKEVEKTYGVTVAQVKTLTQIGKKKNRMTKSGYISGSTATVKKALVKVANDEVIDFYSAV